MNEQKKPSRDHTDEIGNDLETGDAVNAAIEQQGDDAAAGIPRDTDAARQEHKKDQAEGDDRQPTGSAD